MKPYDCVLASISHRVTVMDFRVLLADSDPDMLDLYRRFFGRCWYDVETVASGVECVAAIRTIQPHVLVLHRNLLWGGFEGVLDRIRRDRELPHVPVVAIEERGSDPTPHNAQIIATLTMPFRIAELDRLLRSVFTSSVAAAVPAS